MIIECPNCNKKFNLNDKLIPEDGRDLKCSTCEHVWHYKIILNKNSNDQKISEDKDTKLDINISKNDKKDNELKEKINYEDISDISDEVISEKSIEDTEVKIKDEKVNDKNTIKLKMIFIYLIIFIISLLGIIFLLDTFKYNLSDIFPGIVTLFDSLYDTLLDIKLFLRDLAN